MKFESSKQKYPSNRNLDKLKLPNGFNDPKTYEDLPNLSPKIVSDNENTPVMIRNKIQK